MQSSNTPKPARKKTIQSPAIPAEKAPSKEVKKAVGAPRASQSRKAAEPASAAAKNHRGSASTSKVPAEIKPIDLPAHEEIAILAYSYWVERNYEHGFSDQDWHRAIQHLSQGR